MRHNNEMDAELPGEEREQQRKDEADYDMFMGTVDEDDEKQPVNHSRKRMAAKVNGVTRTILHIALQMGVAPSEYVPQLNRMWVNFSCGKMAKARTPVMRWGIPMPATPLLRKS